MGLLKARTDGGPGELEMFLRFLAPRQNTQRAVQHHTEDPWRFGSVQSQKLLSLVRVVNRAFIEAA